MGKVRGRLEQGAGKVGARFGDGWSEDARKLEQGSGKIGVRM